MENFYDVLKQGLEEAIEYEKGNRPSLKVDKITVSPLPIYSSEEIKAIREKNKVTQKLFAKALGVSVKTVEAWEKGTNSPSGIARRMLELANYQNNFFENNSIITRNL